MIKYLPRWVIFQDRGLYWVCKKPGGGMASGKTIQEAKDNFRKNCQPDLDEFLDALEENS